MFTFQPVNKYEGFWIGNCPQCGKSVSFCKNSERTVCTWCHSWLDINTDTGYPKVTVASIMHNGQELQLYHTSALARGAYASGL